MARPVIGLTTGRRNPFTEQNRIQDWFIGCDHDYVDSVVRSDGACVLLPRIADQEALEAAVDRIDGLLLTGGGDIVSLRYGEEPHRSSRLQDPIRDEMEFTVLRLALEKGIPVLGICRGLQVINVALGGTLVQDLVSEIPDSVQHWTNAADSVLCHTVYVEEDSVLAKVLGTTRLATNSWHHQCVKQVGQGLRVSCRSADGIVEGLESSESKQILAVQFHAEESAPAFPVFQRLFDWLVTQAKSRL
jgi:putative glutamine amidotransferase